MSTTTEAAPGDPAEAPAASTTSPAVDREERPLPSAAPETVPAPDETAVRGEAPAEMLAAVTADLAGRIGVDPGTIETIAAAEVVWPDGALGCPSPGEIYRAQPTAGWHIVLAAAGGEHDYRAAATGFFKLCEIGPTGP